MSSITKVVYPGSFDPLTLGHLDVIKRAAKIFDELHIVIAESTSKSALFTPEERKDLILKSIGSMKNVKVDISPGLTVDYVKKVKAHAIIRGLRAVSDFEYELAMATMNRKLAPEIETLVIMTDEKYNYIASNTVKEVAKHGGDISQFVSKPVEAAMKKKFKGKA